MGILDEVEKIDEKLTLEERVERIEKNQEKILQKLDQILVEVSSLKISMDVKPTDRISR